MTKRGRTSCLRFRFLRCHFEGFKEVRHSFDRFGTQRSLESSQLESSLDVMVEIVTQVIFHSPTLVEI